MTEPSVAANAPEPRPRRALVLSGGGARGAYEAGVVAALFEHEEFDIVCGTSIGAINGALAAQGATDQLRELWRGVPERAVIRGVTPIEELRAILRRRGLTGKRTWRQFAADLVRGIGALRHAHPRRLRSLTHVLDPAPLVAMLTSVLDFTKLQRVLIVGVTNLTLARPEAFYAFPERDANFEAAFMSGEATGVRMTPANYIASILASAAIPLAFPMVSIPDDRGVPSDYIDGGVGNNTPIRQAIDAGAEEVTVVIADHIALRDRDHRIADLGAIALVAQDILQQQVLELDLKLTRRVNEAVLRGAAPGKRFVRLRTIGPSINIPLPVLGFQDLATIERAFDQGYVDGRAATDATGLGRLFDIDPTARRVSAGDVLFREGEAGEVMYVLTDGEVELTSRGERLTTVSPGEIFGEFALLGVERRRATATATSDGAIVQVDAARFRYLVQYAPSFALVVMRTMSSRLRFMDGRAGATQVESLAPHGAHATASHLIAFRDDPSIRPFAAGETIFSAGDPGGSMFVVVEGEVAIVRDDDVRLVTAHPGDVFGELSLCDQQPRSATARAVGAVRVVQIDTLRFTYLVQNNPNFAIEVMRTMADRIRLLDDVVVAGGL